MQLLPLPRSARRTPVLARFALALALPLLLVACDGGSNDGSPTEDERAEATRTVIGTLPTLTPPPSTGTAGASPDASGTPSGTPGDASAVGYGVATVEVETGEVAVLYEGEDAFRPPLGAGTIPLPEAGNGGIWLSLAEDEAVRYALDGSEGNRVEGWGVLESEDGGARSYFVPGGSDGTATLVVERDGQRFEAEGRSASNRQFSPDGRWLAWINALSDEAVGVMLMAVDTGEVTQVAEVPPCACDGYHYLEWSPSSRFLAYEQRDAEAPAAGGVTVYDTLAPDADRQHVPLDPVEDGWIEADQRQHLLALDGTRAVITPVVPADAPPEDRGEPLVLNTGSGDVMLRARTLQGLVAVTRGEQPSEVTVIFDPVSGERLRELRGTSDAVLTPNGIATATITRNDIACTGITVDHPDLKQTFDCTADDLRWSPDGRYLALIPQSQAAPVAILDVTTGETKEVPHAGPRGTVPEWSEDGRYLVWAWGGQV